MVNINELIGQTFGRLTVLGEGEPKIDKSGRVRPTAKCQCSCENQTIIDVIVHDLTRKDGGKRNPTRSCGCLWRESLQTLPQLFKQEYSMWSEKLTDEHGDYYIGWTNNNHTEFYIDAEDFEELSRYSWHDTVDHSGYRRLETKIANKQVKMTKLLGRVNWDHIDRNPMNNRRYNFREVTPSESCINRSKFKNNTSGITGVSWRKDVCKWVATIRKDNVKVHLGTFIKFEDAVVARLEAEVKYFGELAPQQHLFEKYGISAD